jgi:hypothetical protein
MFFTWLITLLTMALALLQKPTTSLGAAWGFSTTSWGFSTAAWAMASLRATFTASRGCWAHGFLDSFSYCTVECFGQAIENGVETVQLERQSLLHAAIEAWV